MVQALLGVAALLAQFGLPAVHRHAAPAATPASHQVVAHDGLACPFCAALAQGHAGTLALAPAPVASSGPAEVVAPPPARLPAAPAPTRAAPRGPPALA